MEASAIRRRIRHGLIRYMAVSAYLYVCFIAVLLYKAAILYDLGVSYSPFGFAALKALVVAKFLLIGEELRVGERLTRATMRAVILWRSAALLLLLLVLSAIEQLLEGLVHHRSLAQSVTDFDRGTGAEILATSVLLYFVLLPYVAYGQLEKTLGHDRLHQFMRKRAG
jgi:hypothetical protein